MDCALEPWAKVDLSLLKLLSPEYVLIATEKETITAKGDAELCLNLVRKDGEQGGGWQGGCADGRLFMEAVSQFRRGQLMEESGCEVVASTAGKTRCY